MLQPGQLISEKYRVLEEAGAGELGPLYRVQELETGKVCALKIIKLPDDADRDLLRRLLEDVDRIENLKGPHIIPPGRVEGADGNQPYVVREFLEGVTLEELIRKEAPVPFHRACSIARQVAQALETAHHAGIVHGDLKPSRILLVPGDGAEIVKVLGFGFFTLKQNYFLELSKLALKDGDHPLMGAPEYISPEQAIGTGAEGLDGRSDLYSLGIIWHQMLTGEVPFRGQNTMEILLAHLFTVPPPLHNRLGLEVPETLDRLLMRMLAKKREDRPASATAVVDQLSAWETPAGPSEFSKPLDEPTLETRSQAPSPELQFPSPEPLIPEPLPPPLMASEKVSSPSSMERGAHPDPDRQLRTPEPVVSEATATVPPVAFGSEPETAFVADIHPSPSGAPEEPPPSPLDIPLHEESAAPPAAAPPPRPTTSGPVIFGGYVQREVKSPRKSASRWAIAAIVIIILLGAGCGWLYLSGRTYWFRPDFVKWRISSFLSSSSMPPEGAPPSQTPRTAPQPAPPAASATPSAPQTLPTPKTLPQAIAAATMATPSSSVALTELRKQPKTTIEHPRPSETASSSLTPAKVPVHHLPAHPHVLRASLPPRTSPARSSTNPIRDALARGDHLFEHGEYDNAIQAYESGLAIDPENQNLIDAIARAKRAKAAEAKFLGQ